jgi:hypothetical protein
VNSPPNPSVGLTQYYKSARGLITAVAAVALPFASKIVGSDAAPYVFPPLGGMDGVARVGLVLLCLSVSVGVYFLAAVNPPKSPSAVVWKTIIVAIVSLTAYLAAYQRFVRQIDVATRETSVHVSVGYQRTQFASQTFGSASDWAMLEARGTDEEEIERLWTVRSVIIARLTLYLLCTLTTLSFLFLFSFALAHDISGQLVGKTRGP